MTHFEWLQAKKARFVSAARKGGMSEAALARLPKPIVPKRDTLPPVVLATKKHTTNPVHQEASRAAARKAAALRAETRRTLKVKRVKNWRLGLQSGRSDVAADRVFYNKIVNLAAEASGQPAYGIHDFKRLRDLVRVRHMCWLLLREFTGLSSGGIARVTGRGCHSSIINGIGRALRATKTIQGAALYWELRTRLCAAGHPILDELEKGGEP